MAGWFLIGEITLIFTLSIALFVLVGLQVVTYLRLEDNYRQLESLFSLFSIIQPNLPLPAMRGWSISPDFANVLVACIRKERPALIVEAGSGVSTLIAGYCLRHMGAGSMISLDHQPEFFAKSANHLASHGLQDVAEVVYAPLQKFVINGEEWLWYDTAPLEDVGPIDMLIIDGPPYNVQQLARYPALPLLISRLSDDATILLDDAARRSERRTIKRWQEEFPGFSLETVRAEKGAAVLRRTRKSPIHASHSSNGTGPTRKAEVR